MNRGSRQPQTAGYGRPVQTAAKAGASPNQYDQDPYQGQGDQYGQEQDGAGNYDQQPQEEGYGQQQEDDPASADVPAYQKGGQGINGVDEQEHPEEDQVHEAQNGHVNAMAKKGAQGLAGKPPGKQAKKPQQHAHSRFTQDPHHHNTMMNFHKIATEGLTHAHIESFVHVGTFALAHLAKQVGMTAGHEPEEEEDEHANAQ